MPPAIVPTQIQSALSPAGPSARSIDLLWQILFWTGSLVTVVVLAALVYAVVRRRSADPAEADRPPDPRGERFNDEAGTRGLAIDAAPTADRIGVQVMVGAGIVAPAILLGAVLLFTMRTLREIVLQSHVVAASDAPPRDGEIAVRVTGLQYWWRVEYLHADAAHRFETANELRIPVGRSVTIRLESADVIHSFWVPALHGKMDLVPGRTNAIALRADSAGTFRGQCAEFCGVQHANMAFVVVALPEDAWRAWIDAQRAPAETASGTTADSADAAVFLGSACVGCHTVRGTTAAGRLGPDLTHFASRLTIGAAMYPNTPGHRYGWIANPQALKPGNAMPRVPMSSDTLHAIARYLGTLR